MVEQVVGGKAHGSVWVSFQYTRTFTPLSSLHKMQVSRKEMLLFFSDSSVNLMLVLLSMILRCSVSWFNKYLVDWPKAQVI